VTAEQRAARVWFEGVIRNVNPRARVKTDAEGWPTVPGRYGTVEWFCDGVDCHSCPLPGVPALAVFTTGRYTIPKLAAIPGVKRHQLGDGEARLVFAAEHPIIEAVLRVIGPRIRRHGGGGSAEHLTRIRPVRSRVTAGVVTGRQRDERGDTPTTAA
jgi:hypothetical protein